MYESMNQIAETTQQDPLVVIKCSPLVKGNRELVDSIIHPWRWFRSGVQLFAIR